MMTCHVRTCFHVRTFSPSGEDDSLSCQKCATLHLVIKPMMACDDRSAPPSTESSAPSPLLTRPGDVAWDDIEAITDQLFALRRSWSPLREPRGAARAAAASPWAKKGGGGRFGCDPPPLLCGLVGGGGASCGGGRADSDDGIISDDDDFDDEDGVDAIEASDTRAMLPCPAGVDAVLKPC